MVGKRSVIGMFTKAVRLLILSIILITFVSCFNINNRFYYNKLIIFMKEYNALNNWIDYGEKIKYEGTSFFINKNDIQNIRFIKLSQYLKEIYHNENYSYSIIKAIGKYGFGYNFYEYFKILITKNNIEIDNFIPEYNLEKSDKSIEFIFIENINFSFNKILIKFDDDILMINNQNNKFVLNIEKNKNIYSNITIISVGD